MKKLLTLLILSTFSIGAMASSCEKPRDKHNISHTKIIHHKTKSHKIKKALVQKIPSPDTIELTKAINDFANTPNSKSTVINLLYNKEHKNFSFDILKKDGSLIKKSDLVPLEHNSSLLTTYWMASNLSLIKEQPIEFNDNGKYIVSFFNKQETCSAFYLSYHLKGDAFAVNQGILINHNGDVTTTFDKECEVPTKNRRDTIGYTQDNYITGVNFTSPSLSITKPVSFNTTVTKEGFEELPTKFNAYAISSDFTHFYTFNSSINQNKPFFGMNFSQNINYPSNYYFVVQFDGNNGSNNSFVANAIVTN
jgi:hypothetical protein